MPTRSISEEVNNQRNRDGTIFFLDIYIITVEQPVCVDSFVFVGLG